MPQEQLTVRSTKARDLAHKLARKQRRTVSQVVEMALERLEAESRSHRPMTKSVDNFWADLHRNLFPTGTEPDIDLNKIIEEHRQYPKPIDL
jgi:hypothetical protein